MQVENFLDAVATVLLRKKLEALSIYVTLGKVLLFETVQVFFKSGVAARLEVIKQ